MTGRGRFICRLVVLAALAVSVIWPQAPGGEAVPAAAILQGSFHWTVSPPLLSADTREGDPGFSVKDPTVVYYKGKWHVFCTIRRQQRTHSIEYVSFDKWENANAAPRHVLQCRPGYFCAPQVFYFRPHRKWYLVYQAGEQGRKLGLQPAFSTTTDISDPNSWTPAELFFPTEDPPGVSGWIDFWVICDSQKAYLFFTSLNGRLWRMSTPLADFPHGFANCQLALEHDIFEAGHLYSLKGLGKYLAVIEAQNGPGGWRHYHAYLADALDGAWQPLAASEDNRFAGTDNITFAGERWTDSISHGELIRAGYDETLEVDPASLQFLFQGVTEAARAGKPYGQIPWQLGLLTAAERPE